MKRKTKEQNTPNPVKKLFKLSEVGFNNLDGNFIKINFDQRDFGNSIFNNGSSIDMDTFAKELHATGEAEINDIIKKEIPFVLNRLLDYGAYSYRVIEAVKNYVNTL